MRAGCGLAARRNASDRAHSVRDGRACARTFKLSPCGSAASPQVDPVGPALLRGPQLGVSAMTVDGRRTRSGWAAYSKRRALTYLSWPTSATAIRLEWLSGARALARARTCTEPSRLANLAQQPIAVSHRLWPSHSYVAGDERTQRAQARHREGKRTTKFAIDNAERPTQIYSSTFSFKFTQVEKVGARPPLPSPPAQLARNRLACRLLHVS